MFTRPDHQYDAMGYARCGKSGLKLPAISMGLWHNFGDETPYEASRALILRSFELGITHFDIANNYGPPPGAAERTFGRILREELTPYRDELIISSKAGYHMWPGPYGEWGSKKSLMASLDQSLRRCGLDYFDIFYHHRPDPDTPLEETMEALKLMVTQGKALYAGISNYSAAQTKEACAVAERLGLRLLIHQVNYSMFRREPEEGLMDVLRDNGVGAIAYMPLAQGILTRKYFDSIPADSRAAGASRFLSADAVTAEKVGKARRLDAIAARRGQSLSQMAIAWVLRTQPVCSALIGATKVSQIEENVKCLDSGAFTAEELAEIDGILE